MSQVIYIFGEFFTSTAVSNPDLAPEYPGGGATEVASRLAKQCHGAVSRNGGIQMDGLFHGKAY